MGKKHREYIFDPQTLSYRENIVSFRQRTRRLLLSFAGSFLVALFYLWLYISVFHLELPKTTMLKKQNAQWCSKMSIQNKRMDDCRQRLEQARVQGQTEF